MFLNQIQISPGIVNSTAPKIFNNAAPDTVVSPALSTEYGIIAAAVTLIAGLLIFLAIDWRLDVHGLIWRPGGEQGTTTNIANLLVKVMLIMIFVFAGASILLALFPYSLEILLGARILFALAIISLIILTTKIIVRPPTRNTRNQNSLT